MRNLLFLHGLIATLLIGCVGNGELEAQLSGQVVGDDDRPLGPGLVMVERGKVHAGAYEGGALIANTGKFEVPLPGGGTWGVHLFNDNYSYLPVEVTIDPHQQVALTNMMVNWGVWMDLTGQPRWPDQPDDARLVRLPVDDNKADNPVIQNIQMKYLPGGLFQITADVSDPTHDLSRMILAFDEATGGGYAMNPPGPPNASGYYPEGSYSLKVFTSAKHVPGKSMWHLVVSDAMCNNTPIQHLPMPPK
jgi:hypothetical protein